MENPVAELLRVKGIPFTPAIITVRCGDPRHSNRHVLGDTREHYLRDLVGDELVDDLLQELGIKEFNIRCNEVIPNYDLTSAGGRWSPATRDFIDIVQNAPGMQLCRLYAGEHELTECKGARFGKRLCWAEAIERTLSDLQAMMVPNQVDIFRHSVLTAGSKVCKVEPIAKYRGCHHEPVIIKVPADDF